MISSTISDVDCKFKDSIFALLIAVNMVMQRKLHASKNGDECYLTHNLKIVRKLCKTRLPEAQLVKHVIRAKTNLHNYDLFGQAQLSLTLTNLP